MQIKVNQIIQAASERYPYTHRVELLSDNHTEHWINNNTVSDWLNENSIPHTQTGRGVFYLNSEDTSWLLLRWT
jgi:hypothetical protein